MRGLDSDWQSRPAHQPYVPNTQELQGGFATLRRLNKTKRQYGAAPGLYPTADNKVMLWAS